MNAGGGGEGGLVSTTMTHTWISPSPIPTHAGKKDVVRLGSSLRLVSARPSDPTPIQSHGRKCQFNVNPKPRIRNSTIHCNARYW